MQTNVGKKALTNKLIALYHLGFERGQAGDASAEKMMAAIKPLVKKILAPAPTPKVRTLQLAKDGRARRGRGASVTITNKELLKQLRGK